jgi:hypothetical protein
VVDVRCWHDVINVAVNLRCSNARMTACSSDATGPGIAMGPDGIRSKVKRGTSGSRCIDNGRR